MKRKRNTPTVVSGVQSFPALEPAQFMRLRVVTRPGKRWGSVEIALEMAKLEFSRGKRAGEGDAIRG